MSKYIIFNNINDYEVVVNCDYIIEMKLCNVRRQYVMHLDGQQMEILTKEEYDRVVNILKSKGEL